MGGGNPTSTNVSMSYGSMIGLVRNPECNNVSSRCVSLGVNNITTTIHNLFIRSPSMQKVVIIPLLVVVIISNCMYHYMNILVVSTYHPVRDPVV